MLQFCGPTGADGTEAAIKLAKTYTGRDNVIAFSGGYHGMTHGALAMTGNFICQTKGWQSHGRRTVLPYPHEYRCPLGLGGEAGVDALTYYFENFIEDVESGVVKPAAVILEDHPRRGAVSSLLPKMAAKVRGSYRPPRHCAYPR